jgi:hypothetical protein
MCLFKHFFAIAGRLTGNPSGLGMCVFKHLFQLSPLPVA